MPITDALIWFLIGSIFGWLIVFKYDQQAVFLLEGKQHRTGKKLENAKIIYKNKKKVEGTLAIMIGAGLTGVSAAFFDNSIVIFWISSVTSFVFVASGVVSRSMSFHRADKDLDGFGSGNM